MALHRAHSSTSTTASQWGAQSRTRHPRDACAGAERKGQQWSPTLLSMLSLRQPRRLPTSFAGRARCCVCTATLSTGYSRSTWIGPFVSTHTNHRHYISLFNNATDWGFPPPKRNPPAAALGSQHHLPNKPGFSALCSATSSATFAPDTSFRDRFLSAP